MLGNYQGLDIGHSFYVCRVEACSAERSGESDAAEVADEYRARAKHFLEIITAAVVQADALAKEVERREVDATAPRNVEKKKGD